jgi:hypothetical protein
MGWHHTAAPPCQAFRTLVSAHHLLLATLVHAELYAALAIYVEKRDLLLVIYRTCMLVFVVLLKPLISSVRLLKYFKRLPILQPSRNPSRNILRSKFTKRRIIHAVAMIARCLPTQCVWMLCLSILLSTASATIQLHHGSPHSQRSRQVARDSETSSASTYMHYRNVAYYVVSLTALFRSLGRSPLTQQ